MVETVSSEAQELFDRIAEYLSAEDYERVQMGFAYAKEKHAGQKRKSGEPYVTHPATVAYYLAEYQLDADALIAALLHDVAEDTPASIPDIANLFGTEVAEIVDGVTKFQRSTDSASIQKVSDKDAHDQTVSKLFRFMTRNVRVIIIKIFDRLHNMRTIGSMPPHKKRRIAQETLDIYARLANRLGMWEIKNELERISFQIIDKDTYGHIKGQLIARIDAHTGFVNQVCGRVSRHLRANELDVADVCVSPRNVYTIYKKHKADRDGVRVDNVPRMLIVVSDKRSCYLALGLIHELWRPIPREFDDYIAQPRDNLYRALHTTVRHESGGLIKFRIRTQAMAVMSEIGVLGRWGAPGRVLTSQIKTEMSQQVDALLESIDRISSGDDDTGTKVETVLGDLLSDQLTSYTPNGDPIELPTGSTALDFAFKIHTQVGLTAQRSKVNGVTRPLNTPLSDGDTVRILGNAKTPKRRWLDDDLGYLNTSSARSAVRRAFRNLSATEAVRHGRRLLNAELKMFSLQYIAHDIIADWFGLPDTATLYQQIGRAEVLVTDVARRALAQAWHQRQAKRTGRIVQTSVRPGEAQAQRESFIVLGADDVGQTLQLCGNCRPRPGSRIRGYLRRDGRLTVHQLDCHQLPSDMDAEKLLDLTWGQEAVEAVSEAQIEIDVYDRPNLLFEITDMLREEHINIPWISTPRDSQAMRIEMCLALHGPNQLVELLHRFKALANVRSVRYVPPEA